MKLTIGMATYDDYDGVYFTVQAIRMHHPEVTAETEILVVDNHPDGPCAEALKRLESHVSGYRYIANGENGGTSQPRNKVFSEAQNDYVLCIDSHVLLCPGALRKLIDYFIFYPDTNDLLQGPLIYDNLKNFSTHFQPEWREGMYGIWAEDERGNDPHGQPFEIPMQGLGIFACRKEAWLGFNTEFRGFGGEEGYIHEKFRQAGYRTLCLPFLRWVHRFDRPSGVKYPLAWEDRIRNYWIGHLELGLDTADLDTHFQDFLGKERYKSIMENVILPVVKSHMAKPKASVIYIY
jgi:glycosyltransferase involved in cell wall biosynthesis